MDEAGGIRFPIGYDCQTGLYFDQVIKFDLPESVVPEEAKAAAVRLLEPFAEYSVADPVAGKAVLLSLMLTALRRPFLQTAPLFVIRSSMAGAGKGLVVACAVYLAYGTRPVLVTYGGNGEEFEKRLAAVMLQSPAALSIDNANGMMICGDLLESLITEGAADIRPLGRSETYRIQNCALLPDRQQSGHYLVIWRAALCQPTCCLGLRTRKATSSALIRLRWSCGAAPSS
jgi:hypothetical protein